MTVEEAIARLRARWAHPPLDPVDVRERVALRGIDGAVVIATPPACRLLMPLPDGGGWRSLYVHALRDVDAAIDALRATIAGVKGGAR